MLALLTDKGREHHGQLLAEAAQLIGAGQLGPIMGGRQFDGLSANAAYDLLASGAQRRLAIGV